MTLKNNNSITAASNILGGGCAPLWIEQLLAEKVSLSFSPLFVSFSLTRYSVCRQNIWDTKVYLVMETFCAVA